MGQLSSTDNPRDKYDFGEKLGEGTFGVVYKARNQQTNEVCAVKEIKSTSKHDLTQRDNETKLLKQSGGHDNIVSLIDIFSYQDKFYIVLEFCELGDLDRYVTTTNPSVDSKVLFMYDMSNGLEFLHQINIVHRDMKPANVLVTSSQSHGRPVCKISDLGEAKMHAFAGQLSNMASNPADSYLKSLHGTMAYIAPEVLQNHYTSSCDVFSLGVTFYALFSYKPGMKELDAFVYVSGDGLCMYKVPFDERQSAVEGLQTLPTELKDLTLKMLKDDYHKRVECSAVKDTLNNYISH